MEILKNKKVLVGGLVLLGIVGYFFLFKKKKVTEIDLPSTAETPTASIEDNYAVTLGSVDPTGGVWLVLGGKKYGFISETAWTTYGYTVPKVITKEALDLIPDGGFVDNEGKIVKS
jgi:hypothetical protein